MARILLIEDEGHIAKGIVLNLEMQGHEVIHHEDGSEGLNEFLNNNFDLMILDLMLPGMMGEDIIQQVRLQNPRFPVLILSAKDEAQSKVKLFKLGSDDYLSKPFHLEEFLQRVERLLLRGSWQSESDSENREEGDSSRFYFGDFWIDFEKHMALGVDGEFILTEQELKLLQYFITHRNKVIRRAELLAEIGYSESSESRTLDNFVVRFRKYFETNPKSPQIFKNIRGVGYKLEI